MSRISELHKSLGMSGSKSPKHGAKNRGVARLLKEHKHEEAIARNEKTKPSKRSQKKTWAKIIETQDALEAMA